MMIRQTIENEMTRGRIVYARNAIILLLTAHRLTVAHQVQNRLEYQLGHCAEYRD